MASLIRLINVYQIEIFSMSNKFITHRRVRTQYFGQNVTLKGTQKKKKIQPLYTLRIDYKFLIDVVKNQVIFTSASFAKD